MAKNTELVVAVAQRIQGGFQLVDNYAHFDIDLFWEKVKTKLWEELAGLL